MYSRLFYLDITVGFLVQEVVFWSTWIDKLLILSDTMPTFLFDTHEDVDLFRRTAIAVEPLRHPPQVAFELSSTVMHYSRDDVIQRIMVQVPHTLCFYSRFFPVLF